MLIQALNAVLTVIAGVGAAVVLYWALNKIAEFLPGAWEDRIKPYFYILPAYTAITVFVLYPAVQTVVYSFKTKVGFPAEAWTGLSNYTELLTSAKFQQTLLNTLLWIIIVPVVTIIIGLGIAVLSDKLGPRPEKTVKTLIFMPMAISAVGTGVVWGLIYDFRPAGQPQLGIQNAILDLLGMDPIAWMTVSDFKLNSLLLMVMLLWNGIGFAMVLLSAAVKGVPEDTLEAARIDGASERQIFFRVVVPQIKPTIITVYVTTLIGVMKVFDIVYVMTRGNFDTNVVGVEFYIQFFTNNNQGAASAIVVMLMIAIIPIMIFQVRDFRAQEANA